ncbi:MAG: C10 family peptidase [Tidjanibacter sp.]|nr:C10 family peptidase [Tidjanibacter sp.]
MNKLKHLLLLALIGLSTACSYNELPVELPTRPVINERMIPEIETRAETYNGEKLDQEYFVSATDLEDYIKYRGSISKRANFTVKDVESYGLDSSHTLFYIVNYDQGWEVVSADKRLQPRMAYGDNGEFDINSDNEPMQFWISILADGVLQTRRQSGDTLASSSENATNGKGGEDESKNDNVDFWDSISSTSTTRGEINTPTWGPLDSLEGLFPPPEIKRYFIPGAIVHNSAITTVGTIAPTRWGQEDPWHWACPTIPNSNEKSPAGCTAVAGAQLLYSLKMQKGWNIMTPSFAFCNAVLPNTTQIFGPLSTEPWEKMALSESDDNYERLQNSRALIAYAGYISDMSYGISESGAYLSQLQDGLAEYYNISCTESSYGNVSISGELQKHPILVSGYEDTGHDHGHSWMIDQYRIINTVTNRYYIETYEDLTYYELSQLTIDDATGYITTFDTDRHYHMNWGWDGICDGYYGLPPEDWDTTEKDALQYGILILHNFILED